jgi:hypothetical protein
VTTDCDARELGKTPSSKTIQDAPFCLAQLMARKNELEAITEQYLGSPTSAALHPYTVATPSPASTVASTRCWLDRLTERRRQGGAEEFGWVEGRADPSRPAVTSVHELIDTCKSCDLVGARRRRRGTWPGDFTSTAAATQGIRCSIKDFFEIMVIWTSDDSGPRPHLLQLSRGCRSAS